jgi:very-short-patch-repair endonuclease
MTDISMFYGASPSIFEKAKELRKKLTHEEELLWSRLKQNQISGLRFKSQHPISKYIADFYCHKLKLVIEVDGGIHNSKKSKEYDEGRNHDMHELGIKVIRLQTKK